MIFFLDTYIIKEDTHEKFHIPIKFQNCQYFYFFITKPHKETKKLKGLNIILDKIHGDKSI